jgi:hypothetical protein
MDQNYDFQNLRNLDKKLRIKKVWETVPFSGLPFLMGFFNPFYELVVEILQ